MKPNTVVRGGENNSPAGQYMPYVSVDTGLTSGTRLLTLDGEIPAEILSIGDKLITRDCGVSKVTHIQRTTRKVRTISFAAGSLGHTRPERDTFLAGDQMVLIRDWRSRALFNCERALVPARALVDHEFIIDQGEQTQVLIQIFCADPHIIYAGGLELGTADASRARGAALDAA
ncbi:Hint domain-containing protein [Sulfitobacter marinus]|uniref:Hint domain-containing protein n=1 Tax=Sulfitobacter marinus TaxID=394264 RepID=A0A1I6PWB0_9RHOB|nr:Hint domain-containing protein [Sulfitobacter marinus]SFS44484.1 Hint domain-containing protein [Sulfitobacter marinus]